MTHKKASPINPVEKARTMKPVTPTTDHLEPATRVWFQQIATDYSLESHHVRILLTAAEMWDRASAARESVQENGVMVMDRYGCLKANPACEIERSSKTLFLKSLRELGLDVEEPTAPRQKPLSTNAGRRVR